VLTLLASSGDGPTLWTFFGRFHPATVHFPVAMLSAAALMEFLQIVRRKPGLSSATFAMTVIGLASAILATVMGWANASGKPPKELLETHRWAGVWTTVIAAGALALVFKARAAQGWIVQAARASLFLVMILVSLAGHWGGQMSFGETYYSDAWPWSKPPPKDDRLPLQQTGGRIDFKADIAPIIQESCFLCHGGEKSGKNGKGGLKLTTKALAMKGGDSGPCIVPKKPEESSFYTLLLARNPDERMPEKAKPLPAEQIDKIKRWILQGAEWPDGFEFKKP
jgi:uncharacterized membrane protein